MTTATATDVQNNFGKYLQMVQTGEEIIILRNGKEMAAAYFSQQKRFLFNRLPYRCSEKRL